MENDTSKKDDDQHIENVAFITPKVKGLRKIICSSQSEYEFPGDDLNYPLSPKTPLAKEVEDRINDVWVVTRLAVTLYTYLWTGFRWYINFLRLLLFTLLLMPGFFQMVLFYFFSPRIMRSIPYGSKPRNRLDVYLPRKRFRNSECPVCIYVTGGAWVIGYKAWGALISRRLSQRGVLVFCLDYRNFPQGSALDMLQDINTGIAWCLNNAPLYGGSKDVFIVGQSAGGHLTSYAVLAQAERAALHKNLQEQKQLEHLLPPHSQLGAYPAWDISSIKGFAAVSGAFNLETLAEHQHKRGLYKNMFDAIMAGPEGAPMVKELSPVYLADTMDDKAVEYVPRVVLIHGSADESVPLDNAADFAQRLQNRGIATDFKVFQGKTHTQPIVEDPMRGGRDPLMDEILSMILGKECYNLQFAMAPAFLINAATAVCPF